MKKSLNLTLTLLKRSGPETKLFVIITTLISATIFNFINLISSDLVVSSSGIEKGFVSSCLILTLAVAFFVFYVANNYLNKVNSSAIGIEVLSGVSTFQLGFLLTFRISILNFLGYLSGIILGIIISPIFNFLALKKFVFQIHLVTFVYILAFFILQSFTLGLINQGFGYRNDVTVLLGLQNKSQYVAEAYKIKLRKFDYLCMPLMLLIFAIFFIPLDIIHNLSELSLFIFYIPLLGCFEFFRKFLPKLFDHLKEKKYLNHKYNLVLFSNLKTSVRSNLNIFMALLGIGVMLPSLMVIIENSEGILFFNALSYILSILFITFLLIFNTLSNSMDEINSLKQLRVLGYSKKDVLKILKLKINIFYALLILPPFIFTSILMLFLVINFNLALVHTCIYLGVYVLIFFLSSLITYSYSLKLLNQTIE